ncbi:MAG: hypothetical protein IKS41_03955 [Alphaproteobacteria bacterium]|nr:hypothetical protein [Alphaproteobacteria bacterium]
MLLQIRSILFRSFILAIAFLFVAYNVYSMAPHTILTLVHQFFGVSIAEAKSVILHFYCWVKVVAVWLFFVPALAITWYQFDTERQQQKDSKNKKKK